LPVLSILLTILKIIGIIILVLLGLVLLAVLALLLVPLRYELHALKPDEANGKPWSVQGKVTWLLRLISLDVFAEGIKPKTDLQVTLRLAMKKIVIAGPEKNAAGAADEDEEDWDPFEDAPVKDAQETGTPAGADSRPKTDLQISAPASEPAQAHPNAAGEMQAGEGTAAPGSTGPAAPHSAGSDPDPEEDAVHPDTDGEHAGDGAEQEKPPKKSLKERIDDLAASLSAKAGDLAGAVMAKIGELAASLADATVIFPEAADVLDQAEEKIHGVDVKIRSLLEQWGPFIEEDARDFYARTVRRILKMLHHWRIRLIRGCLDLGTGSPDTTAYAVGALHVVLPACADRYEVRPHFDEPVVETDTFLKGHIRLCHAAGLVVKTLLDKEARHLIGVFLHKGKKKKNAKSLQQSEQAA